jgi:hypothetical protein
MKLTTEDGTSIVEPSELELQATLARLGLPGNGFAIVASAPENYVQVAGSRADGYVVEYREGSENSHHTSEQSNIGHQQMSELLSAYIGGRTWKGMISWHQERVTSRASKPANRQTSVGYKATIILFFSIGATSLATGGYLLYATHHFLARAVEVPGKVTKMVQRGNTYAPVVAYVDLGGSPRVLHTSQSSSPPSFYEGENVQVVYDPADPKFPLNAKIRTFGELWGTALFALLFGGMFGGIALAVWLVLIGGKRAK